MNKKAIFISLLNICVIVGIYQLPTIETVLAKQDVNVPLNENFTFAKEFQQGIENSKISLLSKIDDLVPQVELKDANAPLIESIQIPESSETKDNVEAPPLFSNPHCTEKCKVLMVGDSMMGDLTYSLTYVLRKNKPDWKLIDGHKVSSGLSNENYYNWNETIKKLIEVNKPDYVFVLIGTNDAQGLKNSQGKVVAFKSEEWKEVYGEKVQSFISELENSKAEWYWLDLPVVRSPGFNAKLSVVRSVQQLKAKDRAIEVESIFGKSSGPTGFLDKKRNKDGIHFNSLGANQLAEHIYTKKLNNSVETQVELKTSNEPIHLKLEKKVTITRVNLYQYN